MRQIWWPGRGFFFADLQVVKPNLRQCSLFVRDSGHDQDNPIHTRVQFHRCPITAGENGMESFPSSPVVDAMLSVLRSAAYAIVTAMPVRIRRSGRRRMSEP
jgi:hypothetical protein